MPTFDHLILGTGQATGTLLGRLIPTGESIAVIESGKVGGSCVNYGCTPTKTLVACARAVHVARRGDFFGFQAGEITLNFDRVRERMNEIRNGSSNGLEKWMASTENVSLYKGRGFFVDTNKINVKDEILEARNIYINVGTRPAAPPISGIESVNWLDSARLLELEQLPEHLIIIGGGYIGVEFGQIFRRFGSNVTLLQRNQQLMPRKMRMLPLPFRIFWKRKE